MNAAYCIVHIAHGINHSINDIVIIEELHVAKPIYTNTVDVELTMVHK